MAGDWLKVEACLPEKPEVWQMARILGIDPDAVVGKLIKVWRWFDAHTEHGNALGVTVVLIDSLTGVTGFGEAMALCSWLEQDGSIMKLPRFERHNGKTSKNRALTAKRVAASRDKSNAECNASIVTHALAREEKRREEHSSVSIADDVSGCPHSKIIEAYHKALPTLPRIREWTPSRQQLLRTRWREKPERQDLGWWERLFVYVGKSDFLTGRAERSNGHANWECSLPWLLKAENFAKVLEGHYENKGPQS